MTDNVMFGRPVRAVYNASGNVVGLSAGNTELDDSILPPHIPDARFILENTAGIYQQTGVSRAITDIASRIPKTIWYVSSEATNGFVVGNDANSGASKALAKLTLGSAFAAASSGDVIIINDSETPYDSAFYNINKAVTILPWTARGVTLRSTFASYTFLIGASSITFGAVIIDTNATGASALRSVSAPCDKLRLVGTKLLAHSTYFLNHIGTVEMVGGVNFVSTGAAKSIITLPTASAGGVTLGAETMIDGYVLHNPSVAGVNFTATKTKIRGTAAGATSAFQSTGAASYLIEDCDIGMDTSTAGTGILITPHATLACETVTIRRNTVSHGVAAAQQTSGYGIAVGNETAIAETIHNVAIYENDIRHANHGLFAGYGISSGYSRGNVVRDTIIGCITKGNTCGFIQSANIIIGGPLTGGALRAKTSSNAKFYNNLVIYNAQSVAGGVALLSSNTAVLSEFRNNIVYAPALLLSSAVSIPVGDTASLNDNDYYAGSYGATAFSYSGTTYATVALWKAAIESTALGVDPLFTGLSDWTLSSGSPCRGIGAQVIGTDFMGRTMTNNLGPFA